MIYTTLIHESTGPRKLARDPIEFARSIGLLF